MSLLNVTALYFFRKSDRRTESQHGSLPAMTQKHKWVLVCVFSTWASSHQAMELLRFGSLNQVRQMNADSFLERVILNTQTHTHTYLLWDRQELPIMNSKMITAYTFFSFVPILLLIKVTQIILVLMLQNGTHNGVERHISNIQPAQFEVIQI